MNIFLFRLWNDLRGRKRLFVVDVSLLSETEKQRLLQLNMDFLVRIWVNCLMGWYAFTRGQMINRIHK
jgi:hypothetical protein